MILLTSQNTNLSGNTFALLFGCYSHRDDFFFPLSVAIFPSMIRVLFSLFGDDRLGFTVRMRLLMGFLLGRTLMVTSYMFLVLEEVLLFFDFLTIVLDDFLELWFLCRKRLIFHVADLLHLLQYVPKFLLNI